MTNTDVWVDYDEIKTTIGFEDVLAHYGMLNEFTRTATGLTGICPFHTGKRSSRHLSISFNVKDKSGNEVDLFQCSYGRCSAKGNIISFVSLMENIEYRVAAINLQYVWFTERFSDSSRRNKSEQSKTGRKRNAKTRHKEEKTVGKVGSGVPNNEPLDKDFKVTRELSHESVKARGLNPDTISTFEVEYVAPDSKSMMRNRICWPIYDDIGNNILAYVGRWVGPDSTLPSIEAKYKMSKGFKKSLCLFNYHRVLVASEIVVVEGCFSVMILHQNNIKAVALMGSTISKRQINLLKKYDVVKLFLDGDEAGQSAAENIANKLHHHIAVRICDCPEGTQPDQLTSEEITACLA